MAKRASRVKSSKPSKGRTSGLAKKQRLPPAGSKRKSAKRSPAHPKAKTAAAPRKEAAARPPAPSKAGHSKKDMEAFKAHLLKLREVKTGQISFLSDDSLKVADDTPADDRTDDFDREFALNLVSTEHDELYEIDDALRRIGLGTYGMCDECGSAIGKNRLHALPFARLCLKCQSENERGKVRFRPFGDSIEQTAEPSVENAETEEAE
jgi:RNA polymerase-binding protein DksA